MHVVHDPMKRRQVDRFDDAHVVERNVQVKLGECLQLAADKAGARGLRGVEVAVRIEPQQAWRHASPLEPGDHAKLDSFLGIVGKPSGAPLQPALQNIPGLEFYPGATLGLGDNVEFDKTKFAAYADAVTLAKLVLLTESPVDGATTGSKQLSKFVNSLSFIKWCEIDLYNDTFLLQ